MSTASRICTEPGCPEFAVDRGRCDHHRLTTTERGYGAPHQAGRRELEGTLPRFCAYGCGRWLTRADRWVAAHVVDGDPSAGLVVGCVSCNERAKRRGHTGGGGVSTAPQPGRFLTRALLLGLYGIPALLGRPRGTRTSVGC